MGLLLRILPERCSLYFLKIICGISGTLRTLDPESKFFSQKRIKEIVEDTAKAYGAKGSVKFQEGYPALINNEKVVNILKEIGESTFGKEKISFSKTPSMGGDDFSFFLKESRGAYYNLGCGNKAKGWTSSIHKDRFMADEECIKTGVILQVKTLIRLLKSNIN